jgi:hypothetical protein
LSSLERLSRPSDERTSCNTKLAVRPGLGACGVARRLWCDADQKPETVGTRRRIELSKAQSDDERGARHEDRGLTPELIEKAKKCETLEERMAFIEDNGIELSDEQLESIAGGRSMLDLPDICEENTLGGHNWEPMGRTAPGEWFGDLWPDKEKRSTYCGKKRWFKY